MSKRVPNQARSQSVYKEFWEQANYQKVLSASDLTDDQLKLLAFSAAEQGGEAADRCYTFFSFHPTEDDVRQIECRCAEKETEWLPWLSFARDYRRACDEKRDKGRDQTAVRGHGR